MGGLGRAAAITVLTLLSGTVVAAPWPACNATGLTPAVALHQPTPPYPESARQAGAEGFVEVAFTVLRDGRVGWVTVERAEPSGFFEAATLDGVRDWRFQPAGREGEAVECRIRTRIRYTLTDSVAARPRGAAPAGDQPAPVYPEQSRIEGLEGYVEVEFEVGRDGRVQNAEVTIAMPRGEFEQAALAAVRAWRFPRGAGSDQAMTRRFDFSLPESYPHDPAPTLLAAAPLPAAACASGEPGRVRLEVEVDAEGRVTAARVLDAAPVGLYDATALAVARNSRMAPAYRLGTAIAARGLLTLRFTPDDAHCGGDSGDPRSPSRGAPAPRVSAVGRH
jgi:protein TonB